MAPSNSWSRRSFVRVRMVLAAMLLITFMFVPLPQRAAATDDPFASVIQHDLQFAAQQLSATTATLSTKSYPETTKTDGSWNTSSASGWTSGFFPGSLWSMYQSTSDPVWLTRAQSWQAGLEGQKTNTGTHDVGFIIFNSFGNGYRLTGNDAYRQVILTAAASLAQRFSPTVGCIRSWGSISDTSNFQVIIDNMMNLELLFWASKHGGKPEWYDMAVSHALKTMANNVRPDGSTYQIANYNPTSGALISQSTKQGYRANTTWSRGQAWAIYGFTMAYRETGDSRFLETARKAADYFIGHLPSDKVPFWDFQAPNIPNEPRDSSAAAIAASGLIELSQRETDTQRQASYLQAAKDILNTLSSSAYLAEGTANKAILLHGTKNKPSGTYDTGLIYGDYYFIEALLRYPTTPPPPDAIPPEVTTRIPASGSTGAAVGTNVTATFNEDVTNVNQASFILQQGTTQVDASVSYDPASYTATLHPTTDLIPATTYTASLTGDIADRANNKLAPLSWTFTTAALPAPSATRIKNVTFEDGSLTHASSGVDAIKGSITLVTAGTLKGMYSARVPNVSSAYLEENVAATDDIYVSLYLRLDALPKSDTRILQIFNGSTTVSNIVVRSNGALRLRNGSTTVGSDSERLQVGTIYRIGLHQKKGNGANATLEAYLATGDAGFSTPFASSGIQKFTSAATRLRLGATSGTLNAVFDDIKLDTSALP